MDSERSMINCHGDDSYVDQTEILLCATPAHPLCWRFLEIPLMKIVGLPALSVMWLPKLSCCQVQCKRIPCLPCWTDDINGAIGIPLAGYTNDLVRGEHIILIVILCFLAAALLKFFVAQLGDLISSP